MSRVNGWFGAILRNAMPINVIYLIGMATTFVLMFLDS
jgi:hypothetical protein